MRPRYGCGSFGRFRRTFGNGEPGSADTENQTGCTFVRTFGGANPLKELIGYQSTPGDQSIFDSYAKEDGTEPVSGIGDKAIWTQDIGLLVIVGKRLYTSNTLGFSSDTKDAHIQLAKIAITKIKQ